MNESSVIQLMNCVVACMLHDDLFLKRDDPRRRLFDNLWLTTHAFRRGSAQNKFFYEDKNKRWSLKMIKWWAGWAESEGSDVVMRYLLDEVHSVEQEVLADAMAPDRAHVLSGCPSKWLLATHEVPSSLRDPQGYSQATLHKELGQMEARLFDAIENNMSKIMNVLKPQCTMPVDESGQSAGGEVDVAATATSNVTPPVAHCASATNSAVRTSRIPPSRDWKQFLSYYYIADPAKHLFVPVRDFSPLETSKSCRVKMSKMRCIAKSFDAYRERFCSQETDLQSCIDQFEDAMLVLFGPLTSLNPVQTARRRRVDDCIHIEKYLEESTSIDNVVRQCRKVNDIKFFVMLFSLECS